MIQGLVEADPTVVGILIGAIAVLAIAFVVVRLRRRKS
jgi:LPXTG-motif cell wall-anchored protein